MMHLFYRSLIATALALFVMNVGKEDRVTNCSCSDDGRPTPSNHQRSKRLYAGNEVKEDQYPYVVFLKIIITYKTKKNTIKCKERLCTGTLVHTRFVLTTSYCVADWSKVLIFSNTRPYHEIKGNMVYLSSESVTYENGYSKPMGGNVALIKMNSTFPNVKEFPTIWRLNPIPSATELKGCITVGFGLIGRNFSTALSPTGQVRPMMYPLKITLDFSKCIWNPKFGQERFVKHNQTFLCEMASSANSPTLCENGDEGSPLLCPNQKTENSNTGKKMNYNIYGLADIMPSKESCDAKPENKQTVLFVYMLRSSAWIYAQLDAFNRTQESETDSVPTTKQTTNTTTASDKSTTKSTTTLPEYYDTGDYDSTRRKTIRRCGGGGRVDQYVRGSSSVRHNRVLAEDAPSSVAATTNDPTRCGRGASVAVAACVYYYYNNYYFRHCNNLLVPPRPRQYV